MPAGGGGGGGMTPGGGGGGGGTAAGGGGGGGAGGGGTETSITGAVEPLTKFCWTVAADELVFFKVDAEWAAATNSFLCCCNSSIVNFICSNSDRLVFSLLSCSPRDFFNWSIDSSRCFTELYRR